MRDRKNTLLPSDLAASGPVSTLTGFDAMSEKAELDMPPLSPLIPTAATKENTAKHHKRLLMQTLARALFFCTTLFALWNLAVCTKSPSNTAALYNNAGLGIEPETFAIDGIPSEPSVVIIAAGSSPQWTVSIPQNSTFPLDSSKYRQLSAQCAATKHASGGISRHFRAQKWQNMNDFYSHDRSYLDVARAADLGVLPASNARLQSGVCRKSITFVFDEDEAGFGQSLILLWMSYGLAKKEGRAFFIDDSRWAYGSYLSYFSPLPEQGCEPAPPEFRVPCPHDAAHLVISSATAPWTFSSAFDRRFLKLRGHSSSKGRRIFDLLRKGYEDLFHLAGEYGAYAAERVALLSEEAERMNGPSVGIHVRRGDRHPFEYQYDHDYLPLDRYAQAIHLTRLSHPSIAWHQGSSTAKSAHVPVLLASDDPNVIAFSHTWLDESTFASRAAQDRIELATKATLEEAAIAQQAIDGPPHYSANSISNNDGWDGGFYKALFLALGSSRANQAGSVANQTVTEQGMFLRGLIGRAYLLDIAVLSSADNVVCAVSSATCRLLGVMMGWDAVRDGKWINIDDARPWSWDGRRY